MRAALEKLREIRSQMQTGRVVPSHDGDRTSGRLYVVDDPQERLGSGTKLLIVQGDGVTATGDTYCLGVFWDERFAEALMDVLEEDHVVADALIVEKLEAIKEGAGPYSRDPLEHCENTVERLKRLGGQALDAIVDLDR